MTDSPTTRSIVLSFPVGLTPKTHRPTRDSLYRAMQDFGLFTARDQLIREATRVERLADKNARCGKDAGAAFKRRHADRLRRASDLLAEVARQIEKCRE